MPGYLHYFCAEWRRARRIVQLDSLDAEALRDLCAAVNTEHGLSSSSSLALQYGLAGWQPDAAEASEAGLTAQSGCESAYLSPAELLPERTLQRGLHGIPKSHSTRTLGEPLPPLYRRMVPQSSASSRPGSARPGGRTVDRLPASILFHNPAHPLAGIVGSYCKDTFAQEMRRRLGAERLFATGDGAQQQQAEDHPIFSVEDAEAIYDILMLMQRPGSASGGVLHMGRPLDTVVGMYFALGQFRQIVERGASSVLSFFNMLDLDKNSVVESSELKHFFKHADSDYLSGVAVALAAESVPVGRMIEVMFAALDMNGDQRVESWELQRQLALVAPPRMSLVEIIGHLEMKYGFCRGGLTGQLDRNQLFDRLCRVETLDVSPEDALSLFRAASVSETVTASSLESFMQRLPVEVAWGVEPHTVDQFVNAVGARALALERSSRKDACLPTEAVLEAFDPIPDQPELRARFERLWERCAGGVGGSGSPPVEKQLRDGCLRRYLEAARSIAGSRTARSAEAGNKRPPSGAGPRSLFPNVGDVLAIATTRLYSGQSFTIRYRLQGASTFWSPGHTVLKNEREPLKWPISKKILGDTPFIGLVPRGLNWTSAGGGGFYLGQQAFTRVDGSLRADLPRDPDSGLPMLYGRVEIVAPSIIRTARSQDKLKGLPADFELRVFCSTKQRIIGCIGEPLPVQVVHHVRPPPVESLQVRCEGRCAALRWNILDLGAQAIPTSIDCVRLYMRGAHTERVFSFDPGTTEWELKDLAPDTQYEFHVRLENSAGIGREAETVCRTNACCSAPTSLACAVTSTVHVELRWRKPKVLGNESTRDQYQQHRESIDCYEATLKVKMKDEDREGNSGDEGFAAAGVSTERVCRWPAGAWNADREGNATARLGGLRPDTQYALENFCAVNSMGRGAAVKSVIFWTVPQPPRIVSVRVRHGFVLVALPQVKGIGIKEYAASVYKTTRPEDKTNLSLSHVNFCDPQDGSSYPELSLPFENMPIAESDETHTILLKASNSGGWSDWSRSFETTAIARQQGAEQAQSALIKAMESHKIEQLARVLEEVRDIEFSDERYVREATELLQRLRAAKHELAEAMQARDPGPLHRALDVAKEVKLPDLSKAELLLKKLENVVHKLETAKGIEALSLALRAAREARLPAHLLVGAMERLGTREATQQGLEQGMETARVPELTAALAAAEGMDLPSEAAAKELLRALQRSESLLREALRKGLICDLDSALASVAESGLREDELISDGKSLLARLVQEREDALKGLHQVMLLRHPAKLREALGLACAAQVHDADQRDAAELLHHLEDLLAHIRAAEGLEQRRSTLAAAHAARVPQELLAGAEVQLECLQALHDAMGRGSVEVLRRDLKAAEGCGIKTNELAEARIVYCEWSEAMHEVDVAVALCRTKCLREALGSALRRGIHDDQLEASRKALDAIEARGEAEARLSEAIRAQDCEQLQSALKHACALDVVNWPLLEEARALVERLLRLRADLAAAVELSELVTLHGAVGRARAAPALPEEELAGAAALLQELQARHREQILAELNTAEDFRDLDAIASRARRSKAVGVVVEECLLTEASERAVTMQKALQLGFESDLQEQRSKNEFPRWTQKLAERDDSTLLPISAVRGSLEVRFKPSGTLVCTLPREVVEGMFVVDYRDSTLHSSSAVCSRLMSALRKLVDPRDSVLQLTEQPCIVGEASQASRRESVSIAEDGHLELGVVVHVRAAHSGMEVAQALCERGHLGADLWCTGEADPKAEGALAARASCGDEYALASTLAQQLTHSLTAGLSGNVPASEPAHEKRFSEYTRNVRARLLRRVTVEVSWAYPRGIMDSLDASCLVFSEEKLLGVIDNRLSRAPSHANFAAMSGVEPSANGEGVNGAVKNIGNVIDHEKRTGKQIVQLRLDLMPRHVSDIFFVVSTGSTHDLSKFTKLRMTVYDADRMAVLGSCDVPKGGRSEAVIMGCIYQVDDQLWHVNSFGTQCKGSTREYKPILGKLLELGYPRHVSMQEQVPLLLGTIQEELDLEREVKSTGVTIGPMSMLRLNYAIELFGDSPEGSSLVEQVAQEPFKRALVSALQRAPGGRFGSEHVTVHPADFGPLVHLAFDMCWSYPAEDKTTVPASAPRTPVGGLLPRLEGDRFAHHRLSTSPSKSSSRSPTHARSPSKGSPRRRQRACTTLPAMSRIDKTDNSANMAGCYLDGTCVLFEEQSLREVIDYRGPHGVRLVTNGVLDYRGIWTGMLGAGDASGGAVRHTAEEMDNVALAGKHVLDIRFDQLPRNSTELFFVLSTPTRADISLFRHLHIVVRDMDNPGHEIATARTQVGENQSRAVVMACASRDRDNCWRLQTIGSTCQGNARDYRPVLALLRAIQERRHARLPQWPYWKQEIPSKEGQQKAILLPRLKKPLAKRSNERLSIRSLGSAGSDYTLPSRWSLMASESEASPEHVRSSTSSHSPEHARPSTVR